MTKKVYTDNKELQASLPEPPINSLEGYEAVRYRSLDPISSALPKGLSRSEFGGLANLKGWPS